MASRSPSKLQSFQLTAARRRLACTSLFTPPWLWFQLTAARRRLVSKSEAKSLQSSSFNSQPPGGGWDNAAFGTLGYLGFNSQPPGGGWTCKADNHA